MLVKTLEKYRRFGTCYRSGQRLGYGKIFLRYLGLPLDLPFPVVVPHGVNFGQRKVAFDIDALEPIYLVHNHQTSSLDLGGRVRLHLPHPWLLMDELTPSHSRQGTLIATPPPSISAYEQCLASIRRTNLPRPWRALIKYRGQIEDYERWWQEKGIETVTAGPISNDQFLYQLRSLIDSHECIASPNMTAALIYGASLGVQAVPLKDAKVKYVDVPSLEMLVDYVPSNGAVSSFWQGITNPDLSIARECALSVLGNHLMAPRAILGDRLMEALKSPKGRIHLVSLHTALPNFVSDAIGPRRRVYSFLSAPGKVISARVLRAASLDRLALVSGYEFGVLDSTGTTPTLSISIVKRKSLGLHFMPGMGVD